MKKYIGIILAVAVIGGLTFWAYQVGVFESGTEQIGGKVEYKGQESKTVLELLKANYTVETQNIGGVETVVSISGKKASVNEYWAFFVGGIESVQAPASYSTKPSDIIRWELKAVNNQL